MEPVEVTVQAGSLLYSCDVIVWSIAVTAVDLRVTYYLLLPFSV